MRALRLVAWVAGSALGTMLLVGILRGDWTTAVDEKAFVLYIWSLVVMTVGLVVWERRPESRTGMLMMALALAGVLSDVDWVFADSRLAVTLGLATEMLAVPLFCHLILSYPTGRLVSRLERGFVICAYFFALAYALPRLLFYDPRFPNDRDVWECVRCAVPLTHVAWFDVGALRDALEVLLLPLAVAFLALLVRKILRATPGRRRVVLPLVVAAIVVAGEFAVQIALYGEPANTWRHSTWFWVQTLAVLAVPVALGVGLLWGRSARSAVADLVVELEHTPPGSVRDALARTLGDPSLELALWLPERASYVDGEGRPRELPANDSSRAVTILGPAEAPVAALVHDPALLEHRALLRSAGAAATLALENERLQAELRLQLAEVRASRARIVRAGDEERRRLERDLHDGAQQRLLSLGLALQLVRSELGSGANGAADLLGEAETELRAALEELRELAHGIHPAVLSEQGLAPALESIAARSQVPVEVEALPEERLPAPVEAAAYFVVSEALANVQKHARASRVAVRAACRNGRLVIQVEDDGIGGAEASSGSGLAGLADRVQALDGRLAIRSDAGCGTRLHVELPLAPLPVGG